MKPVNVSVIIGGCLYLAVFWALCVLMVVVFYTC